MMETKAPTLLASNVSSLVTAAAPPTSSNWMVRNTPHDTLPLQPLSHSRTASCLESPHPRHASQDAVASSSNSSSGTRTHSPLLPPHRSSSNNIATVHPVRISSSSASPSASVALPADVDATDAVLLPVERPSLLRRPSQLSTVISRQSSTGIATVAIPPANAENDGFHTALSTRLVFSCHRSGANSPQEAIEELHLKSCRGSHPRMDDEEALVSRHHGRAIAGTHSGSHHESFTGDPLRTEAQSTLHSSHSRNSNNTAAVTRNSSPFDGSATAMSAGVMNDVPLTPASTTTAASTVHSFDVTMKPSNFVLPELSAASVFAAAAPPVTADPLHHHAAQPSAESNAPLPSVGGGVCAASPLALRSPSGGSSSTHHNMMHPQSPVAPETPTHHHSSCRDAQKPKAAVFSFPVSARAPTQVSPSLSRTGAITTTTSGLSSPDAPSVGHANGGATRRSSSFTAVGNRLSSGAEVQSWPHHSQSSSFGSEEEQLDYNSEGEAHAGGLAEGTAAPSAKKEAFPGRARVRRGSGTSAKSDPIPVPAHLPHEPGAHTAAAAEAPGSATRMHAMPPMRIVNAWAPEFAEAEAKHNFNDPEKLQLATEALTSHHATSHNSGCSLHFHRTSAKASHTHTPATTPNMKPALTPPPPPPPPMSPAPLFSSIETHPAATTAPTSAASASAAAAAAPPPPASAPSSASTSNHHPSFARMLFSRFSTYASTTNTAPSADAPPQSQRAVPNTSASAAGPLPPPPPPPLLPPPVTPTTSATSRISSPLLRAAASLASRFTAATSTVAAAVATPAPSSATSTHDSEPPPQPPTITVPLARSSRISHFATTVPHNCEKQQQDASTHQLEESEDVLSRDQTAWSHVNGSLVHDGRSTSEEDKWPIRHASEALINGTHMVVLPPSALRPQHNGGRLMEADGVVPLSGASTPPFSAGSFSRGNSCVAQHFSTTGHHHHHCPSSARSGCRDSSIGSNGAAGGRSAGRTTPFAQSKFGNAPAATAPSFSFIRNTATADSSNRDGTSTSETSSLIFVSPAQTFTSTGSEPMVLSLSSSNLVAPLAHNHGATAAIASHASSGTTTTTPSTTPQPCRSTSAAAAAADTTTTTSPRTNTDAFAMRPDAATLRSLPRGKVPRMPGCSMRDWTAYLAAKEAEKRREAAAQKRKQSAGNPHAHLPRLTPQEVAAHNTPDDMWMVIHGVVYDCTVFQRFHPGGEKMLLACAGRDATEVYDKFHAWISCESFLGPCAVGVLVPPHQQ